MTGVAFPLTLAAVSLRLPLPVPPQAAPRRLALVALFSLSGCFTILGDDTQGLPLMGDPVPTESLPRLNEKPVQTWEIHQAADLRSWVVMCETGNLQESLSLCLPGLNGRLRVRRVSEPASPKILNGDYFFIGGFTGRRAVYVSRNAATSTRLQVFLSRDLGDGEWQPAATYDLPPGDPRITPGPGQRLFVYRVTRPKTPRLDLLWRDQQQRHTFSYDAKDTVDDDPFFDAAGAYLFARVQRSADREALAADPARQAELRRFYAYNIATEVEQDLGLHPRSTQNHPLGQSSLVSCGSDGLRVILYGPAREAAKAEDRERILDLPPPCEPGKLQGFDRDNGLAIFDAGTDLRRVPLSGAAADFIPKVKQRRVLARSGNGTEAYALDPVGLYANAASDGWIAEHRFMERGLFGYFTQDSKRVRYLEHAATPLSVGDLMSAPVPTPDGADPGPPTLLARNVPFPYFYDLTQPDGRTLAISNAAVFPGPFNRLIAIDEAQGRAQLLLVGANNFVLLRATNDLLVELVNSEVGFDLVRTQLPPK